MGLVASWLSVGGVAHWCVCVCYSGPMSTRRHISLAGWLDERLVERARVEDRPVAQIVTWALEAYLGLSEGRPVVALPEVVPVVAPVEVVAPGSGSSPVKRKPAARFERPSMVGAFGPKKGDAGERWGTGAGFK